MGGEDFVMAEEFKCPYCGSENIQRFPIAYAEGTSAISMGTQTVGLGFGGGSVGVGGAYSASSGDMKTLLAEELEPPHMALDNDGDVFATGCFVWLFVTILSCWFLFDGFWPGAILGIIVACVIGWAMSNKKEVNHYNEVEYPRRYREWQHSWVCLKCGKKFIIE